MDLEQYIRNTLYKENVSVVVGYIGKDTKRFSHLMDLFLSPDNRLAQRAAWVMSHCVERQPNLAIPHLPKMVKQLYISKEDAIKRNVLRILQFVELPSDLWGETLEKCFEYLESNNEAIAIRAFAMTVAYNISQNVPELKPELKALIEEIIIFGSAGLKSRGNKIRMKLEKEL